jgi:hypothetical protein
MRRRADATQPDEPPRAALDDPNAYARVYGMFNHSFRVQL